MQPTVSFAAFAVASSCVSRGSSGVQTDFSDHLVAISFLAGCGSHCSEVGLWWRRSGSLLRGCITHHVCSLAPTKTLKRFFKRLRKFLGYQAALIKITFL